MQELILLERETELFVSNSTHTHKIFQTLIKQKLDNWTVSVNLEVDVLKN